VYRDGYKRLIAGGSTPTGCLVFTIAQQQLAKEREVLDAVQHAVLGGDVA
jgi:hypothetical protein